MSSWHLPNITLCPVDCVQFALVEHHHHSTSKLTHEGSIARELRFHTFNSWNLKEASHESFVFTSSTRGIWRRHRTKASFLYIMDVIWMLGIARNIVFFRVNGASGAVKSRLACATGAGVVGRVSKCARNGTDGSTWFSLFFDDAVLLCFACVETLSALELLRSKDVFYSSVLPFYVSQLSVCRSHWNGCVKVHRCGSCMPNTIVFWSWESQIALRWQGEMSEWCFGSSFFSILAETVFL